MKKVILMPYELADAYALKTLYDYITSKSADTRFASAFLHKTNTDSRTKELLRHTAQDGDDNTNLYVTCYSDINKFPYDPFSAASLNVDICLLKNAVTPLSKEQKNALRNKYKIPLKQPLAVISYVNSVEHPDIRQLVKALAKDSLVCLVGEFSPFGLMKTPGFRPVTEHGVLKDYYAMADLAVNAANLQVDYKNMHNFVEATEGGPLFMVEPYYTGQYGYRELVSVGAIRKCNNLDDIINKAVKHLKAFSGNDCILEARSRHLEHCRQTYLPVIYNTILYILGELPTSPKSDLKCEQRHRWNNLPEPKKLNLVHPDTNWY